MGPGRLPRCLQGHERQTHIDVMGEKPIRPLASSDYTTSSHTLNSRFISPGHPSYSCERLVFLGSGPRFHETPATPRGSPAHHEAGEKPGSGSVCQGPRLMARCWCRHVTEPSAGVPHRDPVQPSANEPAQPLTQHRSRRVGGWTRAPQSGSALVTHARPVGSPPQTVLLNDTRKHDFLWRATVPGGGVRSHTLYADIGHSSFLRPWGGTRPRCPDGEVVGQSASL